MCFSVCVCDEVGYGVQVARVLHCGNHKVFGKDVEHRLADLEHTRGGCLSLSLSQPHPPFLSLSRPAVPGGMEWQRNGTINTL